jgi:hypothetical protein
MSAEELWQGEAKDLTSAATGGKVVKNRYRITTEYVYVESGMIGSKEEQIPLWAIRDVDVRQSIVQKTRGVGDLLIRAEHNDYTGKSSFVLLSIENPKDIRNLVNDHSKIARDLRLKQMQSVNYTGSNPVQVTTAPNAGIDPIERLQKLGELLKAGILTQDEFDAQKSKILNS